MMCILGKYNIPASCVWNLYEYDRLVMKLEHFKDGAIMVQKLKENSRLGAPPGLWRYSIANSYVGIIFYSMLKQHHEIYV